MYLKDFQLLAVDNLVTEFFKLWTTKDYRLPLVFSGLTEGEKMFGLAYNKRLELKKHYQDLGLEINTLVLIQLPNDEKKKDEVVINKEEMVKTFLSKKGVQSSEIAIWLSDKKENKEQN